VHRDEPLERLHGVRVPALRRAELAEEPRRREGELARQRVARLELAEELDRAADVAALPALDRAPRVVRRGARREPRGVLRRPLAVAEEREPDGARRESASGGSTTRSQARATAAASPPPTRNAARRARASGTPSSPVSCASAIRSRSSASRRRPWSCSTAASEPQSRLEASGRAARSRRSRSASA
jgi:hypothetical protein